MSDDDARPGSGREPADDTALHAVVARMAALVEAQLTALLAGTADRPASHDAVARLQDGLERRAGERVAAGWVGEAGLAVTRLLRAGRELERAAAAGARLGAGGDLHPVASRGHPILRHLEAMDTLTLALAREASTAFARADTALAAAVARDRRVQRGAETALRAVVTETIADPRTMRPVLAAFDRCSTLHEIAEHLADGCGNFAQSPSAAIADRRRDGG